MFSENLQGKNNFFELFSCKWPEHQSIQKEACPLKGYNFPKNEQEIH